MMCFGPTVVYHPFDFLLSNTSGARSHHANADDLVLVSKNQAKVAKSLNEMVKTFGLARYIYREN